MQCPECAHRDSRSSLFEPAASEVFFSNCTGSYFLSGSEVEQSDCQ